MSKKIWLALVGILVLSVAIQLIPIDRSNPPVTAEISASNQLMTIFRRTCYDCHSNETVWPWYSRVAPMSWLVAYDTWEGREHLNFSSWGELSTRKQLKLKKEVREAVDEGEMPPWLYLLNHREAELTPAQQLVIRNWTTSP
jgi:Haem-binding domain